AVARAEPLREDLVERRALEVVAVAVDAVLHALAERRDDRLGRPEVPVRYPERHDVRPVLPPLVAVRVAPLDRPVEVVGHGPRVKRRVSAPRSGCAGAARSGSRAAGTSRRPPASAPPVPGAACRAAS